MPHVPYHIYGKVVEFQCGFGRVFSHVNVAPKHKHRHRLDALEAAIRELPLPPESGEVRTFPIGYAIGIYNKHEKRRVPCDRIRVKFRRLSEMPEEVMDFTFPHQKGGVMPNDVVMEEVEFLPVGS